MAKPTLLELVQDILNDMDGDEVTSINDTVESQQVANILKQTFLNLHSNKNWKNTRKLIQIDEGVGLTRPTHMVLPENVKELVSFSYDKHKVGQPQAISEVKWKEPDEFLRLVSGRSTLSTNVTQVTDSSGVILLIINNQPPTYFTSFDDTNLICDSYDSAVDNFLQKEKTAAIVFTMPVWVNTDSAIPDMPEDGFATLREEAKSTAFLVLKQMANEKAEKNSIKQQRWMSRKDWRAHGGVVYSNFGRKGRK